MINLRIVFLLCLKTRQALQQLSFTMIFLCHFHPEPSLSYFKTTSLAIKLKLDKSWCSLEESKLFWCLQ